MSQNEFHSDDPQSFQSHLQSQMQPPLQDHTQTNGAQNADNPKGLNYQYIFKVILIGDSSTGKTSLINRFVNKTFDEKYLCTIGVDFFMKTLELASQTIKLQIWDTAGMEKYKAISSSYYRGSHAAFVVFDLTSRTSFESVTRWIESYYKSNNPQFQKNVVLIGNKVDLEEQREITTAEAENFAKLNKMVYWETSAKDGKNVEEVFTYIGQILFDTYKDENSLVGNSLFMNKDNNQSKSNFTNILHITDKKKCC